MATKRTCLLLTITVAFLILSWPSRAQPVTINSTWTCFGPGNYSQTTCWDPQLAYAPWNRPGQEFEVTISAGSGTVSMDLNVTPCAEVHSFFLGEGRTFKVLAGKCYSVKGQADIGGIIHGNGGDFIAPIARFSGCKAQVWVDGGGSVIIGATTYCATGLGANYTNYTLLSSDGAGSVLNLSAMTELNDGFSTTYGTNWHAITAQNGGMIDLSGLTMITGPTGDDYLTINVNSGGRIDLSELARVSHRGGTGRIVFNVDGGETLVLPSLTSVSSAEFHVTKGAALDVGSSSFAYYAGGLNANYTDYTLLSSDGAGSVLNLSGMTELDDGFSTTYGTNWHAITAQNGGVIDLSGVRKISGPVGDESLTTTANGGTIDLSSLEAISATVGNVSFHIDNGGILLLGNVKVNKTTAITLSDPNDLLVGCSDLDLGTTIMIDNPCRGMFELRGDFSFAHTDGRKASLADSPVFFVGDGPQELEVGCVNNLWEDLSLETNLGFGQMVVGEPNEPAVVYLVDRVDNGNRGGLTGYEEALYLFGDAAPDDPNGLRLLGGSTLYMGGLAVYALVDGVRTDLRTLFGPNDVMISFDQGYLCRDKPNVNDPNNLVCNGAFETGKNPPTDSNCVATLPEGSDDIDCWAVAQNSIGWTQETCFADAADGERFADLSSMTASAEGSTEGQTQAVSQVIQTVPGRLYHVWFDVAANPCRPAQADTGKRSVTVSAAGASEKFILDSVAQVQWHTGTWRFRATGETTTLTFAGQDEPTTGCGVAIDNVIVLDPNDRGNDKHTMNVSSTRGGSVVVSADGCDAGTVVGPGSERFDLDDGASVTLVPLANPGFIFGQWAGLTPADIQDEDPNSHALTFVLNRNTSASASFHDLVVEIADIDTSQCPTIQASVTVTRVSGERVTDLNEANFSVYEDGVEVQAPITAGPRASCVAVSLVLDYSASMDRCNAIPPMEEAAASLVNNMLPQDTGEIIKFAMGVQTLQEHTVDKDALTNAIHLWPEDLNREGTALYDAICEAISHAAQQPCDTKAVVVLTDGMNTGGEQYDVNEVINLAQSNGIRVFTIGLECTEEPDQGLTRIANETRGMYSHTPDPNGLMDIYETISRTLNNQYVVTYETTSCAPDGIDDNQVHELNIIVNSGASSGLDVKTFTCPESCNHN